MNRTELFKNWKRCAASFLVFVMLLTLMPTTSFQAETVRIYPEASHPDENMGILWEKDTLVFADTNFVNNRQNVDLDLHKWDRNTQKLFYNEQIIKKTEDNYLYMLPVGILIMGFLILRTAYRERQ